MRVEQFPTDVFIRIAGYLPARDIIRVRRVSKAWRQAFSNPAVLYELLKEKFPRCRELRLGRAAEPTQYHGAVPNSDTLPNYDVEVRVLASRRDYAAEFARVARRYHNLWGAKAHTVEMFAMARAGDFNWVEVKPRTQNWCRADGSQVKFHHPDPKWWYSQEDGLLVYPPKRRRHRSDNDARGHLPIYMFQLFDPETNERTAVPFDVRGKKIRRVRLAQGVLVFEWAEMNPLTTTSGEDLFFRHFATFFDVVRLTVQPENSRLKWTWSCKFRSSFTFCDKGLTLDSAQDWFLSTHSAKHYAVYFHRSNREARGVAMPTDALVVWDISSPSTHRPTDTPPRRDLPGQVCKDSQPSGDSPAEDVNPIPPAGPSIIRIIGGRPLPVLRHRKEAPGVRGLALDDHNLYLIEEENDDMFGTLNPGEMAHEVRSAGIPVIPFGAASDGSCVQPQYPVFGPLWIDQCFSDDEEPCRHHMTIPGSDEAYHSIWDSQRLRRRGGHGLNVLSDYNTEDYDEYVGSSLNLKSSLRGLVPGDSEDDDDDGDNDGASPGRRGPVKVSWPWNEADSGSNPPSRWPGYAPCWRHEDFPVLTQSEVVDISARVRVSARTCSGLYGIFVKAPPPALADDWPPPPGRHFEDYVDYSTSSTSRELRNCSTPPSFSHASTPGGSPSLSHASTPRRTPVPRPVYTSTWVADGDLFGELMWVRKIAGDERWVIGEDLNSNITIARF